MKKECFFVKLFLISCIGILSCTVSVVAQARLVMEVGGRTRPLEPGVARNVERAVGQAVHMPILEPQLGKVRLATGNLARDRAHMLRDGALNHVERIGRAGEMATGSVTRTYEDSSGGRVSPVGANVCSGNNVNLPEGATPVGGPEGNAEAGYFVPRGRGAAGGAAGPNKAHPNAPIVGGADAGKNKGIIGRAPNFKNPNQAGGRTFVYNSPRDTFKTNLGKTMGLYVFEGSELEESLRNYETDLAEMRGMGWQDEAFKRTSSASGRTGTAAPYVVAKNNPVNLAIQQLAGEYTSLDIENVVKAAKLFMLQPQDTERARIRTLSSTSNVFFTGMNRRAGEVAVEGGSGGNSLKSGQRILYQSTDNLMENIKRRDS